MDSLKEHTSKTQRLNIRIDGDLKDEAQAIYQQLGLDMSTAVTLFLKQSVADNGLPFRPSLKDDNSYTPEQVHTLVRSGKLKPYTNIDDLWKDLNE